MDLLDPNVPLDLSDPDWRVYSRNPVMPPHYIAKGAHVQNSTIAEGCNVYGDLEFSILFAGVYVAPGAEVHSSIIMPGARIEGVVVQEMAKPGLEFIVGVSNDPQLGPMVLAGMGGVFTELFQDAAMLPAPVNRDEALSMLRSLKAWKLLQGYRGGAAADVTALAESIVNISRYAHENRDSLREMDVNPIFVYPEGEGVCAADALIVRTV